MTHTHGYKTNMADFLAFRQPIQHLYDWYLIYIAIITATGLHIAKTFSIKRNSLYQVSGWRKPLRSIGHVITLQNILAILQHGFRIGYSCETQLIATLQNLMHYRDLKKVQVDMTIFDFSKTFDTVPHNKRLYKIETLWTKW